MTFMCAVGDSLVDRYVDQGILYPGGSAANVAVHYKRLGFEASYIGVLGGDEAGQHVKKSLEAEGVNVDLAIQSDGPCSFADVGHDQFGNRKFLNYVPPTEELILGRREIDHLRRCRWVHTGHTSYVESQIDKIAAASRIAFDFSHFGLDYAGPLLSKVSVAVFSRPDASVLECLELLNEVGARGPSMVVVTRGEHGVVIKRRDETVSHRPDSNDSKGVVDTLGAGDAFIAALMTGLEKNLSLTTAAQLASRYASEVCRHFGAFGHPRPISGVYT